MALVNYDYDSSSDNEENMEIGAPESSTSSTSGIISNNSSQLIKLNGATKPESPTSSESSSLFSQLPQARITINETNVINKEIIINDRLEDFIPTVKTIKEKKKVQITIPSLSDFNDLDDENEIPAKKKRVKPSEKGSGLMDLLPAVQHAPKKLNTMFVPNTVKRKNIPVKPKAASTGTCLAPNKQMMPKKRTKQFNDSDSDTDNEDIPIPDTYDDKMWEKVCGRSNKPKPKPPTIQDLYNPDLVVTPISSAPETEKPYNGLNNEGFKELLGSIKRPIGNIKLIDINEEQITSDADGLWRTKSLTDPEVDLQPEAEEPVDPTRKKKHHITFLAQQAKEKEQEFKAVWATSKNNRLMSRAKYGF